MTFDAKAVSKQRDDDTPQDTPEPVRTPGNEGNWALIENGLSLAWKVNREEWKKAKKAKDESRMKELETEGREIVLGLARATEKKLLTRQ